MYSLFVNGSDQPYADETFEFPLDRSIRKHEYTEEHLARLYGTFSQEAVAAIKGFPAILAHEHHWEIAPKFVKLTSIERKPHANAVTVTYEDLDLVNPLTHDGLFANSTALDIGDWELNRTHWAIKDVDLKSTLAKLGCTVIDEQHVARPHINIENHRFNIALSFPGTVRDRIENIIPFLEREFGPNSYFYDRNYPGELARKNLDLLFQSIYRERSELVLVFIGSDYVGRDWCGVEWDAIRDSILGRDQDNRVMFIRTDDGNVPGINSQDGFIDWRHIDDQQLAEAIIRRYHGDRLPNPMQEAKEAESEMLDKIRRETNDAIDDLNSEIASARYAE